MKTPLAVLFVEDDEIDMELTLLELRRLGHEVLYDRVQTAADMRAVLGARDWNIILSDYSMPQFDALAALRVLAESGKDIPVIIISGTVGEETAVEALHAGATDFLVKGKLARLGPAVDRALGERATREARRHAETALSASDLRFRRLWEAGIIGITIADTTGSVIEANDHFLGMVGYSRDDLLAGGVNWARMTPPEWVSRNLTALEQIRVQGFARPWEKEYFRKDGTRVPVLVAVATLEGSRNLAISLDLSERKRLEEQFRQAQRMEAIGSLAGGVAHDFNNLLSVILSYTGLALEGLTPGDPLRDDIEEVKKAGERAIDLTRQLLAFSRKQMLQPRALDMNQVAMGMEKMLRRIVGEDVQLSLLTSPKIGVVSVDRGQLEQVIMNLVVNARDAMPTGGKLVIETCDVELDASYASQHQDVQPGAYVMLAVTDTGCGMAADVCRRVFEPSSLRKSKEKGRGLASRRSTVS